MTMDMITEWFFDPLHRFCEEGLRKDAMAKVLLPSMWHYIK
jgi:hypothetical protein